VPLVGSKARAERHPADFFLAVRLAIAQLVRAGLTPCSRRERARRAAEERHALAARFASYHEHGRSFGTSTRSARTRSAGGPSVRPGAPGVFAFAAVDAYASRARALGVGGAVVASGAPSPRGSDEAVGVSVPG
jgi:hypothetical protein